VNEPVFKLALQSKAMKNKHAAKPSETQTTGFTLSELVVAVAITGTLSAIAIPNYLAQLARSQQQSAQATISGIKTVIASYADETGELPTTWDQLNGITAIMTSKGEATGSIDTAITLPEGHYQVSITGPNQSLYEIEADRIDNTKNHDIKACLEMSNGAIIITKGDGTTSAIKPTC
jgi:type IV pilus assembly protein PilA